MTHRSAGFFLLLRNEQGAVAITQKTEIVVQGMAINLVPILSHERRYEQKQRALGLVEIGNDCFYYMIVIARRNYDLRVGSKRVQIVAIEIFHYFSESFKSGKRFFAAFRVFIRKPLVHCQIFFVGIGIARD